MLRIITFAFVLLIVPATSAEAAMPGCSQLSDLPAARLRWTAVRKKPVNPAHNEERCLSYRTNFFEAVTTRDAASLCRDSLDRQRTLELLDSEIDAFNELIATQCTGRRPVSIPSAPG